MDYDIAHMKKVLKKQMDGARYEHTLGVMYTAACLAMRHGEDLGRAMVAGLLHDCAKCVSDEKKIQICKKNHIAISQAEEQSPYLLHAKVGAYLAREKYGVRDEGILSAIACHTTGKPGMADLDKIIFIADYIEPMRSKAADLGDVRKMAFQDLDLTLFKILSDTLAYLGGAQKRIDSMTLQAYAYYKEQVLE